MGLLDRILRKEQKPSLADIAKTAEQGSADAQCKLGFAYADGEGVPQNFSEACRWFRLAAQQGQSEAQFSLGVLTNSGQGTAQNVAERSIHGTAHDDS